MVGQLQLTFISRQPDHLVRLDIEKHLLGISRNNVYRAIAHQHRFAGRCGRLLGLAKAARRRNHSAALINDGLKKFYG